jgi:16S rRNA (cytosine1402-N4)-methyltransferase
LNEHQPVLLSEVTGLFAEVPSGVVLDCTFGAGGHARAILKKYPQVTVIGIDQDPDAAKRAESFAKDFPNRFHFYGVNFAEVEQLPIKEISGALMDLGVSSFQLDEADRGFSFRFSATTDMRMNPNAGLSAAEFLETAHHDALIHAVRDLGEEIAWRKVVESIVDARGTGLLEKTDTLAELVAKAVRSARRGYQVERIHPATLTFQGIRMAINDELGVLERAMPGVWQKILPGGVFAVISFHSLEDRIVKRFFRKLAGEPEHRNDSMPKDLRHISGTLISRRPIVATENELSFNPRSRSAKLRAIRKLA